MIALVRLVIAASTASGSRVSVSPDTSTNTGTAPAATVAVAVAMNVTAGMITSSPQPISRERSATSSVTVPLHIVIPWVEP